MTVIAYRDGVMASDGRATYKDYIDSDTCKKVFRLGNGGLVGIAGHYHNGQKLLSRLKWASEQEAPLLQDIVYKGVEALLVDAPKRVLWYYTGGHWDLLKEEFAAIGSGYLTAIGALMAGATAVEAVNITKKKNMTCGGRTYRYEVG